jgi:hypothetical protein
MKLVKRILSTSLALAALVVAGSAAAQDWRKGVEDVLKQQAPGAVPGAAPAAGAGDATTSSGLKEALRVGTENAVRLTSAPDGFLGNPKIKIPLPGQLDSMAKALRGIGMSAQVDELEVTMNRAAEKAAGEATPVFVDAIGKMSFQDAQQILGGGNTAATEYFRRTTSETLTARFRPIVESSMKQVGLVQQYDALVGSFTAMPFAKAPSLDLTGYVTQKGLDGLFLVVGEEESKIRTNPAARTTDLLKQVFGR